MSIDLSSIEQLLKMGSKASTIIDQLSRDKKYSKPIKEALGYGYSPSSILQVLTGTKRKPQTVFTPEEEIYQEDKRREERLKKGVIDTASTLAGIGIAATKLPTIAKGAADAFGGALETLKPKDKPRPPSPEDVLAKTQLKEKISRLPSGKEDITETLSTDFPQLEQVVRKLAISGVKQKEAYDRVKQMRLYAPLVKRYEESGRSFQEKIKEVYDSLKPQRKRAQDTSMLEKLTAPDVEPVSAQFSEKEALMNDLRRLRQLLGG